MRQWKVIVRRTGWIVAMVLGLGAVGQADHEGMGVGIMLGEPTGLTFKKWVSDSNAFDAAIGWSFVNDVGTVNMHVDYLWHDIKVLQGQGEGLRELSFFYGLGGRFKTTSQAQIGLRIPLGINYQAVRSPLELFVEIVPILNLAPSTTFNVNGGLGLRLYFL